MKAALAVLGIYFCIALNMFFLSLSTELLREADTVSNLIGIAILAQLIIVDILIITKTIKLLKK